MQQPVKQHVMLWTLFQVKIVQVEVSFFSKYVWSNGSLGYPMQLSLTEYSNIKRNLINWNWHVWIQEN